VLPSVFIAADALHHLIGKRKPFLTAKRMLTNQTFRDVFKPTISTSINGSRSPR